MQLAHSVRAGTLTKWKRIVKKQNRTSNGFLKTAPLLNTTKWAIKKEGQDHKEAWLKRDKYVYADKMTSATEVEVEVEVGRGRGPGASSHSQARCGAATLGGRPVRTPSTHSPHSHRTRCNYPIYSDPCNQPVPTRGIRVSRVRLPLNCYLWFNLRRGTADRKACREGGAWSLVSC